MYFIKELLLLFHFLAIAYIIKKLLQRIICIFSLFLNLVIRDILSSELEDIFNKFIIRISKDGKNLQGTFQSTFGYFLLSNLEIIVF